MTEDKTYTIYKFIGVPQYYLTGRKVYKMSLEDCFRRVFSTHCDRTMEDFYKRNYEYETESKTIQQIYNSVGSGIIYVPFSKTIDKDVVKAYLRAGLEVRFMRTKDYNTMKKEYISFI